MGLYWVVRYKCLDTFEPNKVWVEKIPYGYGKTKREALDIFWNIIRRHALSFSVKVTSIRLVELKI